VSARHDEEDAMSKDVLIVIRHGPYGGFQAAEALRHANGAMSLGFRPIVVLVDDGVYLAKAEQDPGKSEWFALSETLEETVARGLYEKKDAPAEFYVERESLSERGLDPEELVEDMELIDHEKASLLMAAEGLQLIF
jgi:sulfur relay (sulfurtransferase) DsrF/TusC family protein